MGSTGIKYNTPVEPAIHIGVMRKTFNTIETGKFIPSTILAIKLARFFEMKVEELFTLKDI